MSTLPHRERNHATGYRYTKHQHCEKWRMPDGTEVMTGWIEPGDTAHLDKAIGWREAKIKELQEEVRTYELIRQAVATEAAQ